MSDTRKFLKWHCWFILLLFFLKKKRLMWADYWRKREKRPPLLSSSSFPAVPPPMDERSCCWSCKHFQATLFFISRHGKVSESRTASSRPPAIVFEKGREQLRALLLERHFRQEKRTILTQNGWELSSDLQPVFRFMPWLVIRAVLQPQKKLQNRWQTISRLGHGRCASAWLRLEMDQNSYMKKPFWYVAECEESFVCFHFQASVRPSWEGCGCSRHVDRCPRGVFAEEAWWGQRKTASLFWFCMFVDNRSVKQ